MSETGLQTRSLSLGYHQKTIVEDLSLDLPTGKSTAILGPNGCGKSTLLRALARLMKPLAGQVLLDGADVHAVNTRLLAQKLAILPQSPLAPEGIKVDELVKRGRTPWRSNFAPWSTQDADICREALDAVGMVDLQDCPLAELSGGQRQRAWIALVLAQKTPYLLLDEPTTYLDLPHQLEILKLLQQRNRDEGTTVVSVLHDLNLAARFSDHLVLLGNGGLVAQGRPQEVITARNLQAAFELEARVVPDPVTDLPMVVPL